MADLSNEDKPPVATPVFVFQKAGAQKRSAEGSSGEDGEDSDQDESNYCPPSKKDTLSSFTQVPPSRSVSKNVFLPSSFCRSPSGNSDSEPEEKIVGFRLRPPTLIHGQAPSAGIPNQKPKEEQRSVLRPAVLQAPLTKPLSTSNANNSSKGGNKLTEMQPALEKDSENTNGSIQKNDKLPMSKNMDEKNGDRTKENVLPLDSTFVFGQNIKDRVMIEKDGAVPKDRESDCTPAEEETNYFLQYINTASLRNAEDRSSSNAKFVFGQNMSDRVLSPQKCQKAAAEGSMESPPQSDSPPESSSAQDVNSEKGANAAESLEESAAAYTKATAKKCLLEKVEVRTGEELESNVLQIQCKLFIFEKSSQSWVERGCGLLRLNDMMSTDVHNGTLQSRLGHQHLYD